MSFIATEIQLLRTHETHTHTHLTDPDTIILFIGAESSIKVNPTNALSKDPKYASRTSGDTGGDVQAEE